MDDIDSFHDIVDALIGLRGVFERHGLQAPDVLEYKQFDQFMAVAAAGGRYLRIIGAVSTEGDSGPVPVMNIVGFEVRPK